MSEVIISVRGAHEVRIAPEEAVARIAVRTEGAVRADVVSRSAEVADPIRRDLDERLGDGGLRRWASERTTVWSERPWHPEGARLDPVHHVDVDITATFGDFDALSRWMTEVVETEGVQLTGIQWLLTPQTRARLEEEAATAAVGAAVARARSYAGALGLATVEPEQIADVGLLADDGAPSARRVAPLMATASFRDDGGSSVEVRPEDVVIAAAVDARFRAR